jgi:hypothetical protein
MAGSTKTPVPAASSPISGSVCHMGKKRQKEQWVVTVK